MGAAVPGWGEYCAKVYLLRPKIKCNSPHSRPKGLQRFNVLGALNAITHEVITVTNDTYITGTQVCELLQEIANLKLAIPITRVLDNARYQAL